MDFNLGKTVQGNSTAGKSTRIKGNQIVDVTFEGAIAQTLEKKDKSESFDVLTLKFKDENGLTYEDSIFEPRVGDDVRKENNFGYENPSNVEELQFKIKHLLSAVAPDVVEKMNGKAEGVKINGWEALRQFVAKQTVKAIGKRTQIKLVNDKDGNPRFPGYVLGITKAGDVYPKTNFIGANLSFTAKELERIAATEKATPTKMSASANTGSDDLDIDTPASNGVELDLDLDLA